MTEKDQENEYGNPNGITRRSPMPGEGSCSNCEKDQEIPWLISRLPHLDSHSEWVPRTGYIHTHDKCIKRCSRSHVRSKSRHQEGGHWNALD